MEQILVKKIISGGQIGADVAALDAALELGLPIGGFLPKGRKQIGGALSTQKYPGMEETDSSDPKVRTKLNVLHSDATLIFSHGLLTHGSLVTAIFAKNAEKPCLHVDLDRYSPEQSVALIREWLRTHRPQVLNVAGPPCPLPMKAMEPLVSIEQGRAQDSPKLGDRMLEEGEAALGIYEQVKQVLLQALLPGDHIRRLPIQSCASIL